MKSSKLLLIFAGLICFFIFTSETFQTSDLKGIEGTYGILDSSGKLANTGAPGENTCSQLNCHGGGGGSLQVGGLAVNAGPGSITLNANPAFVGNTYVPNQVYTITITVAETGKNLYGFGCEFLDNSGSTNTLTNNSVGLITITNSLTTRKGQPFGTGRVCATHQPHGGSALNAANFIFKWTAPASGTVNVYYDGTASNHDNVANGADNVYAHTIQLTVYIPPPPNSIIENLWVNNLKIFPNPVKNDLNVSYSSFQATNVEAKIIDVNGKLILKAFSKNIEPGDHNERIDVSGISAGVYFLVLKGDQFRKTQKILIAD